MCYTSILVAVDNDHSNDPVSRRALDLAERCNARLHLLHIVEPPSPVAAPGVIGAAPVNCGPTAEEQQVIIEAAEASLEELSAQLGERVASCQVIESALTRDSIHEVAEQQAVDLIVVGSHGRHGWSLLLSGSTASEILKDAPCDVLAVRIGD